MESVFEILAEPNRPRFFFFDMSLWSRQHSSVGEIESVQLRMSQAMCQSTCA